MTNKKFKKVVKNLKKKDTNLQTQITGLPTSSAVQQAIDAATLTQGSIAPVMMSITDPNKTVFTRGPFTISIDCSDAAGLVNMKLLVRTTEMNSVLGEGDGSFGGDLDPGDGDVTVEDFTGNAPGGDAYSEYSPYYGHLILKSPSGTNAQVQIDTITNYMGAHCYADGFFIGLT